MNPLLSICVPTYGRPDLLKITLTELITQARPHGIQIVISDNSEDTRSEQVVESLRASYADLVYSRNERNLGIDLNFLKIASLVSSAYAWFFGDDDLPIPGAVDRILRDIENSPDVQFFLINSMPMSPDMVRTLSPNLTGIKADRTYSDCRRALREISWYSTFVGAYVVRLDAWRLADPTPYLDTAFVHTGVMFEAMARLGFPLKLIAQPLIRYRTGNATWSNSFLNIQFVLWKQAIDNLPTEYDTLTRRIAVESVVERFVTPSALVGVRTSGNLNAGSFRTIVIPYLKWANKRRWPTWRIAGSVVLLLLIPVPALQWLRSRYRRLRYGEACA